MNFSDEVKQEFITKFPFCLLSNVILYRNDKDVADLYANEIDCLFHYKDNNEDHLVIVEVKNRDDIYGEKRFQFPTQESPWKLFYDKEKDIKKQVYEQTEALRQFCANVSKIAPVIEGWIIDTAKKRRPIISDTQYKNSRLKLLTFRGFENLLDQIQDVVRIEHSDFLRELRRGIVSPDVCHPEIQNAIKFIDTCRKSLDDRIYQFFKPTANFHAINGCAGMGKSVLLAYSIYVFASDYCVEYNNGKNELINFSDNSKKYGLPLHIERKIYAYAVKRKQIEILEYYWKKIKNQIALIHPDSQPHLQNPIFKLWQGEIPHDCNVLVIDESHDLSHEHQQSIAKWINNGDDESRRYLLVACDRNQALKQDDSEKNVIAGVNFSRHSTRLNRIYRCPFPVYVASIGLMFRWFAIKGPKVLLSTEKLREHFGFKPKIDKDYEGMILKMRSDCHPGNNWSQTVSYFNSCSMALKHLSHFSFDKKDVLWASFQKLDSDFDYNDIGFTWVDLRTDPDDEIDKYIKGQEFHVVVIEGLPSNMNPKELIQSQNWEDVPSETELEMWRCRRNIYVVCSRASAFLYFISDIDNTPSKPDIQELRNLIDRVSHPIREKHESGQTWEFKITEPSIIRKPLVFRDIDHIEGVPSEPIQIEELQEIEFDGKFLTVPELSEALGISINEFQRLLPKDSKAKKDISITVKLQHVETVARQLGKKFIRVKRTETNINIENEKNTEDKGSKNTDNTALEKASNELIVESSEETINKIEQTKSLNSNPTIKFPSSPKSSPKKAVRINFSPSFYTNNKITQDALIDYVVKILYENGGHAEKSDVEEKIHRLLNHIFKQPMYQETVSNTVPKWKHDIAWAKEKAKQKYGYIKSPKESGRRGLWELTEEGKKYYQMKNLKNLN